MGRLQLLEEAWSVMKLGEDQRRRVGVERGRVVVFNGHSASQAQSWSRWRNRRDSHVCDLGRDTHDTNAVRVYGRTDMVRRLHLHLFVGQESMRAEAFPRETSRFS